MSAIDPASTLGTLVAERSERAPLFERLRLDYCCGGSQTLAEACAERRLDLETVRTVIELLDEQRDRDASAQDGDWREASLAELCEHVVRVHHARVREQLPRIEQLLATAVSAHGDGHPEMHDLQRTHQTIRAELEPHLASEEQTLFPALVALERDGTEIDDAVIGVHERDHRRVGDRLATMRELTGDYDPRRALCATHRALLQELDAFERDLHRHIHEENNLLLPAARKLMACLASERPAATGDTGHA